MVLIATCATVSFESKIAVCRETDHSTTPRNISSGSSNTSKNNISETAITDLFDNFEATLEGGVCMGRIHLTIFGSNSHAGNWCNNDDSLRSRQVQAADACLLRGCAC